MSQPFFKVVHDPSGIPFYIIPTGTTLYRGESSVNQPTYTIKYNGFPIFFGFDKDAIEKNYGITYQFTTISDIICISIDLLDESSLFYINSPPKIQKILRENYGLVSKKRLSESDNDKLLSNYLCKLGIDGYATNIMDTLLDSFHAEIAICNITGKINQTGPRMTSDARAEQLSRQHILIQKERERRELRREQILIQKERERRERLGKIPIETYPSNEITPMFTPTVLSFNTPPGSPIRRNNGGKKKRKTIRSKSIRRNKTSYKKRSLPSSSK